MILCEIDISDVARLGATFAPPGREGHSRDAAFAWSNTYLAGRLGPDLTLWPSIAFPACAIFNQMVEYG